MSVSLEIDVADHIDVNSSELTGQLSEVNKIVQKRFGKLSVRHVVHEKIYCK